MSSIITARNLSRQYGRVRALDGIDLEIPSGRIVGLIGPNGAGKTTALKAILGLSSYRGELSVLGMDPASQRDRLMRQVCFIADVAVLPRWARVHQIIELTERLHPNFSRQRCQRYLKATSIPPKARIKTLSKGMVVQLHLALVMSIEARLLVLDEPTLGLDILFRKRFYSNLLNEYFDEDRTILITTHQVEEVEHILTDLIFIKNGRLVLNSNMDEVYERYVELMVRPDQVDAARSLQPLHERVLFGRHIFLFDRRESTRLEALGEIHRPSIADLFVALMGDGENEDSAREAAA